MRTDNGYITKLIERDIEDEDVKDGMLFDNYIHKDHKQMRESGIKKCCKKHSKNIIDLIEVGDIVEILTNDINDFTNIVQIINDEQIEILKTANKKYIKSIVTKEQFNSIKYEINN